jgi:hypothetical protein
MTNMWKTTKNTRQRREAVLNMSCKLRVNKVSGVPSGLHILNYALMSFPHTKTNNPKKFLLLTNFHIFIINFVIKYPRGLKLPLSNEVWAK